MSQSSDAPPRIVITAHVLALLVPLALVDLVLAGVRAHDVFAQDPTMWQWWVGLRSIFLFHLGTIIVWLVWLHAERVRRRPAPAYVALHAYFTLMATLVVFNAAFFHYLDIQLEAPVIGIVTPLLKAGLFTIVAAEVNPVLIGAPLLVVVLANLFPRLLIRVFRLRRRTDSARQRSPRRTTIWSAAALAMVLAASLLPDGLSSTNFTRERLPALAIGGISEILDQPPAPTPATELPLNTRLVAGKSSKPYNVVMIVMESQRANSTSYYNHELDTTPVFDELAKTSIVMDHAYTAMPHTSKSLVTSHCGVAPPLDSHNSEGQPGGLAARCLPLLLSDLGYTSAFFQSPTKDFEHRGQMVKNLGFQHFYPLESLDKTGFQPVNPLGYEDDIMVKPSVEWAKKQTTPFMLSYMTVTGHYSYELPDNFPIKQYDTKDKVLNQYLNTVRYQDRFVGKVIEGFKKAGLYDNTIFVVMGDHGEGFREHQRRIHNDTIWNEGIHIPMLIRAPGMTTQREITRPVVNTALLPTLVDLLGLKVTGGSYDFHPMTDPRPQPVVSRCWDEKQCIARIEGDHKFIHFYGQQPDAYYDLSTDPGEKHNLIEQLGKRHRDQLVSGLLSWVERINARYAVPRTPAGTSPQREVHQ